MAGFNYYQKWHLENRNPAFVPWHTQACFLVWEVTKDQELKNFIFEMNDWLLTMQQWESTEFSDMQGRFYDPSRSYYGPPHASSTGVYLEGLIDAFTLAKQSDEKNRAENYRIAIVRGIRSIMQLQYKNETDCFYVQNTAQVLGGVRTTVYDNTIRIDNVQHALMAFFKINARFSEQDYQLNDKECLVSIPKQSLKLKDYKHFKQMNFPVSIERIRQEIEENKALWSANTSRQDNIKVQRETNTIFLRSAKKPFPVGVSGNDIHLSEETNNAQVYPVIMGTLYKFASNVGGELSRVVIVRLQPGGRVYPHIDEGDYYKYRDRYHIVINSPTGSEMLAGDEKITWQEGEFWWFDNKAMHEAHNTGADFRVHIIFDVLPGNHKKFVVDEMLKQRIYSKSSTVVKLLQYVDRKSIYGECRVALKRPIINKSQNLKHSKSNFFTDSYSAEQIVVDHYKNVFVLGNKFVICDSDINLMESSLPTYHHKPDIDWLSRKPDYHREIYNNEIITIEDTCAIIANSNWKNYWHWHAQCITNIQALKDSGLFGKVKLLSPPLNRWRIQSLYAMGVTDSMLIKVRTNIIKVRDLYRPSFVNKNKQPQLHPNSIVTYQAIREHFIGKGVAHFKGKKIYVARYDAPDARRLVNEKELENALVRIGFEIIIPGELTYAQQVKTFANSSVIVGAHGAGLTNIVFCYPRTLIIELLPEYYLFDKKNAYRNHAQIGGLEYACYISNGYIEKNHKQQAERCLEKGIQSNFPWKINVKEFLIFLKFSTRQLDSKTLNIEGGLHAK